VGKTTSTVSLAAALASRGVRTLVLDSDPQANATSALGVARPEDGGGLYAALVEEAPLLASVVATETPNLAIVPTSPALAGAEVELVSVMAREFRMKRAVEPLRDQFDVVLIDCPPSLGMLTVNALAAADEVVIPVQTEYFALEGLGHLAHTIELVKRNLNPRLAIRGVLLTMYDARTNLSREVELEVRQHFPNTFATVIPRSVRLAEAPSHGAPIQQYDAASSGARAYEALADEFITALGDRLPARQASTPVVTASPMSSEEAPSGVDQPSAEPQPGVAPPPTPELQSEPERTSGPTYGTLPPPPLAPPASPAPSSVGAISTDPEGQY
jgi:chromosome partitioning protein